LQKKSGLTRYFIFISFKGTYYHGWQLQPRSLTIQEILDEALSLILGEKVSTTGAGRTDAGVHAHFFCAHFDSRVNDLDIKTNFVFKLNRFLPDDIAVTSIRKVKNDANARYSAISRTYRYFITRKKDPFTTETSWFIHGPLDIDLMNMVSGTLRRYDDFTSFSRLHSDNKTNICKIYMAEWELEGDTLVFTIKADRFLRNMVRAITGTMVDIGRKKISPAEFEKIIEARDRGSAGMSAPAKGLFLANIEYPGDIFI
jgi:tRNA pseudouridine38-40 synthase